MSVECSLSRDPGNQTKVWCTWTSLTGVPNKPEEGRKGSHCIVLFHSTVLLLSCFILSFCFSVSVPSCSHFIFITKEVSWILHRKQCCFKPSVMSTFLWRKSNKLSSGNKCFESLGLTCMCFFTLFFVTHFYLFVMFTSTLILIQMFLASEIKLLTMVLTLEW